MDYSFDSMLSATWNTAHPEDKVAPEHFWDICRELSDCGFLQCDKGAVSTIQIGPFHVAAKLEATTKDILTFFVESVVPVLVAHTATLTFNEAYPLYFVPAFKILLHILDNAFMIRDPIQWEVLIYIKNANSRGVFPTATDIEQALSLHDDRSPVLEVVNGLLAVKNGVGKVDSVISIDGDGRIHSLV